MRGTFVVIVLLMSILAQATPVNPVEMPNDTLKARYYDLIAELRCPQCLNTNLAGSDAMIAQNLRETVRRLLLEGKTDAEIRTFLFERYGDFILYDPRWTPQTWLLWGTPFLFAVLGLWIWFRINQRSYQGPKALDPEEQDKLKQLLDKG